MIRRWLSLWFLLVAGLVHGGIDVYEFDDPVKHQRYQRFVEELRCPKCQNQNLAGSDAPIAQDLRQELARLLEEGRSDQEIVHYMVERYGEFVLYRPPLNLDTLILWGAPAGMLMVGLLVVVLLMRRQRRLPDRKAWSAEELAEAQALIRVGDEEEQTR